MRPMAIRPECYPCLERLVRLAVDLATPDPEVRRRALKEARGLLDQEFGPDAIPAAIANRLLPAIYHCSGNRDPFAARKAAATAMAARMYPQSGPGVTATTWNPCCAWPRRAMPWIFSGKKRMRPGRWRPGWSSGPRRCLTFDRNWPALRV